MYETLIKCHPGNIEYEMYYAQTLYKAGLYPEAMRATMRVDAPEYGQRMLMLKTAIRYEEDDLAACKSLVDECISTEPETIIGSGCILYKVRALGQAYAAAMNHVMSHPLCVGRCVCSFFASSVLFLFWGYVDQEGKFEEAREKFAEAAGVLGYRPYLTYNIALCYYCLKKYSPALQHISEIIEHGVREHPELSVGSNTDGIEVRSVGNTQILHETALIEAFNLKAAIEYTLKVRVWGRPCCSVFAAKSCCMARVPACLLTSFWFLAVRRVYSAECGDSTGGSE